MTTFTTGKPSPSKNDTKNASLAVKSRQQVINEVNKRRTLLQDNSWIKKRPEEENTDENYGRVVLNQYKSQDGLHRTTDENDDQNALFSRYRSDSTLDRVSGNIDADRANKLPGLDSRASKSKETDISANTGNVISPVKKKRQSWMPPPVSNPKADADTGDQHKRVPTISDKSGGPKMTVYSSEPSPKSKAVGNDHPITRQICPAKPSESDANSLRTVTTERTRSQDLDNLIKGKATSDKSDQRRQDLDSLIKVKATRDKSEQEGRNLDDLITVNNTAQKNRRSQEVNDLIEIKPSAVDQNKNRSQELDNLIEIKSSAVDQNKKRSQELDNLIEIKPSLVDQNKNRNQELDNLIKVKSSSVDQNKKRQELGDLIEVKSTAVDQNKKWAPEQDFESANIPGYQSEKDRSHQVAKGSSYNASSSYSLPKDTIVYTRTYENSRIPHDAYEDNISRRSIKTVYSTSDRAIIEKEMCTYCRKPLGTDTKMILDALQICCHATCFKCEVCKGPLEELKAGDSIWIYKNTVHCSPCYSDVKASWVY